MNRDEAQARFIANILSVQDILLKRGIKRTYQAVKRSFFSKTSIYIPHQNEQEMARRRKQIAKGMLKPSLLS